MEALALVDSIPGWLRPEDAQKLYELAGSTSGPILEIGTHRGKSVVLMALATKDGGHDARIYTLDVDRSYLREAETHARERGVDDAIVFVRGTSEGLARAYPHLRPTITFIDGDHSRVGVQSDLAVLRTLVPAGGILLFHDFDDPLNDDPDCPGTKVRPTVEDSWVSRECEFNGIFGCCGMFTRREDPQSVVVPIVDLLPLEGPRNQYLHRVRYPAGRLWRRLRQRRQTLASGACAGLRASSPPNSASSRCAAR